MNKRTIYVLVNCNRVFEGTVRNVLPPIASVITATKADIEHCLWFGADPIAAKLQGAPLSDPESARVAVASTLAAPPKRPEAAKGGCKAPIEPDCILYQLTESPEADAETVRLMRRKCRFRDVPIFVITPYSEIPRAKRLIDEGADDVIVSPADPDKLLKRLTNALLPAGGRLPVITKIVNPYISATVDLLSTMAKLHAEKKEVFLKKNYRLFGDVSAIMALSGKVEGEVTVCFEEALARQVVGAMMSLSPEGLAKEELRDGIGEVVNIIAGNAKAMLSDTEYAHQIALPAVVFGHGHEIAHPGNAPCIVVIFEVAGQPMAVLVSMAVQLQAARKETP